MRGSFYTARTMLCFAMLGLAASGARAADQGFLDQWLSSLLDARSDKSWSPHVFIAANVGLTSIAGVSATVDAALARGTIEVRSDEGKVMASYTTD